MQDEEPEAGGAAGVPAHQGVRQHGCAALPRVRTAVCHEAAPRYHIKNHLLSRHVDEGPQVPDQPAADAANQGDASSLRATASPVTGCHAPGLSLLMICVNMGAARCIFTITANVSCVGIQGYEG